jgi:glycosyltransferase involved in cell wall biosynthesis
VSAGKDPPLVSIVTPSLNQARFIEDAIKSVREQDYRRIEHIVVDGGSTDGTLEILQRYPDLQWTSEPDRGQADAIRKGLERAAGSILAWLNADDLYLPGAVATGVHALRASGAGLVYGGWRQIDERGKTIKDVTPRPYDYSELLEVRNLIAQPTTFFTREAYDVVGGIDRSYEYAMDYELWLRLGARFPVHRVDATLAAFRFHAGSKTVASYPRFWRETHRASRRHGGRYFSPMYMRSLPERHRSVARALAVYRLMRG